MNASKSSMGWAIDIGILTGEVEVGAVTVEALDHKTGMIWRTSIDDFIVWDIPIKSGNGEQYLLPIEKWKPWPDYQ